MNIRFLFTPSESIQGILVPKGHFPSFPLKGMSAEARASSQAEKLAAVQPKAEDKGTKSESKADVPAEKKMIKLQKALMVPANVK
jgi:hypothetical protein